MVFCELSLSRIVQRQDSDRNCDRVNLLPNKAECTLAIKATLTPEHQLFLIRANKSRPSGEWSADDYDMRDEAPDCPVIGRTRAAKLGQPGSQFNV